MKTVKEHIEKSIDGTWVGDSRHRLSVGDVGFLLELIPLERGRRRVELRDHPVRQSGSLTEVLYGTVGGDRTDVEALGVGVVTETAPNGRGRVRSLWGDDALAALDRLGYPDLSDEFPDAQLEWEDPL